MELYLLTHSFTINTLLLRSFYQSFIKHLLTLLFIFLIKTNLLFVNKLFFTNKTLTQ